MTAGCAGCGNCCERITISSSQATIAAKQTHPRFGGVLARDAAFIQKWMRPTGEVVRVGAQVRQVWECAAFDPETRRCTQHAARPRMCSEYPWYGRPPTPTTIREPTCSYWLDVPPAERPEGVRPLIPLEVL